MTRTASVLSKRGRQVYYATWGLFTLAVLALVFIPSYLPMVDLPQHAGQISIWLDWNDETLEYQEVYRRGPLSPMLVGMASVYLLAHIVSIELAFKFVIAVAILGLPLVVRGLVKEVGGNPWWVFVSFPVGFGFSFKFGFVSFCLGIPLALFLVLLSLRYSEKPSLRRALGLFGVAVLLFATHAIAFGFGGLVSGLLILARSPTVASGIARATPLLLSLPVAGYWVASTLQTEPLASEPVLFGYGLHRVPHLATFVLGEISVGALFLAAALIGAPLLGSVRFSRVGWRWILLGTSVIFFLAGPHVVFGTAFFYHRFAAFLIPGLLLALDWEPRGEFERSRWWRTALGPAVALVILAGLAIQFDRFNEEVGDLDRVVAQVPRGSRLLYMPVQRASAVTYLPVFLHSGMWHQVRNGGVAAFSFASFHMNQFRFRDDAGPQVPVGFESNPRVFEWRRHSGEQFDYFLVRSDEDRRVELFKNAVDRVKLVDRRQEWWLFERVSTSPGEGT